MKKSIILITASLLLTTINAGFSANFEPVPRIYSVEVNYQNIQKLIDGLFNNYPTKDYYKNIEKSFCENIEGSIYHPKWAINSLKGSEEEVFEPSKLKNGTEYTESLKNVMRIIIAAFDGNNPADEERKVGYEKRIALLNFITKNLVENSKTTQLLSTASDGKVNVVNSNLYSVLNYYFGYYCAYCITDDIKSSITNFGVPYSAEFDRKKRKKGIDELFNAVWPKFKQELSKIQTNGRSVCKRIIEENGEKNFKNAIYHDWFCYFIQTGALINKPLPHSQNIGYTSLVADIAWIYNRITTVKDGIVNSISGCKIENKIAYEGNNHEFYYLRDYSAKVKEKLDKIEEKSNVNKIINTYNITINKVKETIKDLIVLQDNDPEKVKCEKNLSDDGTFIETSICKSNFTEIKRDLNDDCYLGILHDIETINKTLKNKNKLLCNTDIYALQGKPQIVENGIDANKIAEIWLDKVSNNIYLSLDALSLSDFSVTRIDELGNKVTVETYSLFKNPRRLIELWFYITNKNISTEDFERIIDLYAELLKFSWKDEKSMLEKQKIVKYLQLEKSYEKFRLLPLAVVLYTLEKFSGKTIELEDFIEKICSFSSDERVNDSDVLCALLCYMTDVKSDLTLSSTNNININGMIKKFPPLKGFLEETLTRIIDHCYERADRSVFLLYQLIVMLLLTKQINGNVVTTMSKLYQIISYRDNNGEEIVNTKEFKDFCNTYLSEKYKKDTSVQKDVANNFLFDALSYDLLKTKSRAFSSKFYKNMDDLKIRNMEKDFLKIVFGQMKINVNNNNIAGNGVIQMLENSLGKREMSALPS